MNAHCWTRTSPYILRSILKDGRFKTRFEKCAGLGASLDDLDKRTETEQKFYGYALDLPVEQRPIFGYLCRQANGDATHGHLILEEYGSAAIRFKDEIKARTTFCIGDSLMQDIAPIAYNEVERANASLQELIKELANIGIDSRIEIVE